MTLQDLRDQNLILLECISGSKAYGLDLPESDTDIRGIFYLPRQEFYGSNYISQVSNSSNDIIFYELGRFFELLKKNNPTILELLGTPEDKVLYRHPLMEKIKVEDFLSRKCKDTFGGYAFTQVKKARGLNKKIVNPMDKRRKTILEFCFVLEDEGSIPIDLWLRKNELSQEQCGLVKLPHARDMYGIFVDKGQNPGYKGMMKKEHANSLLLSSIPKGEVAAAYLSFNKDGYTRYCKDYLAYWEWVENRNEARYQNNIDHGKNYDSKNMMHTFRLLYMALEILRDGKVLVKRPNREELLKIRKGEFEYDDLIEKAEQMMKDVNRAYLHSKLPDEPDAKELERLLIEIRTELYHS